MGAIPVGFRTVGGAVKSEKETEVDFNDTGIELALLF